MPIYKGSWIPKPKTFKPIFIPTIPLDAKVSELIDSRNQWKENLIYQSFIKEDVKAIVGRPFPKNSRVDKVLWHYNKKG